MKIEFEKLEEEDQVLIRTENSEYLFSVVDPEERRGRLTGGSLGDQTRDAILMGSMPDDKSKNHRSALKPGARALFYMNARNGIERLITSAITELVHLHGGHRRAA